MIRRWVGIDEAGYGPNLGPLVMTAVVAETTRDAAAQGEARNDFDLWLDLAVTIDRAGGDPRRLWIDDSKAIFRGGKGRDRLEAACVATVIASGKKRPRTLRELLAQITIHSVDDCELDPWFAEREQNEQAFIELSAELGDMLGRNPLEPAHNHWRITAIHSVVVGPIRFNGGLERTGSKADVHFEAFADLLRTLWSVPGENVSTFVTGDKHGGRHYYFDHLSLCFPGCWIDRGVEGAESSKYRIRDADRRLDLELCPRADQHHGLVALASIVSKTVRELWMDGFNDYWCERIPGLRRSAGYPLDARRFRRDIETVANAEGHQPNCWWRAK